jgi:hypothetical protein
MCWGVKKFKEFFFLALFGKKELASTFLLFYLTLVKSLTLCWA